ncbi:MAG: hypothetical protein WCF49_16300, partial [Xanthobacteraceae bacterium]
MASMPLLDCRPTLPDQTARLPHHRTRAALLIVDGTLVLGVILSRAFPAQHGGRLSIQSKWPPLPAQAFLERVSSLG